MSMSITFLSSLSVLFQVCIVTGANAGIGLATGTELARMGAHVVLACRSKEKGQAAAQVRGLESHQTYEVLSFYLPPLPKRTGHLIFDQSEK